MALPRAVDGGELRRQHPGDHDPHERRGAHDPQFPDRSFHLRARLAHRLDALRQRLLDQGQHIAQAGTALVLDQREGRVIVYLDESGFAHDMPYTRMAMR